jgi:hypothetical protein
MKFNGRAILFFLFFYYFTACVVAQESVQLILNNEKADFHYFGYSSITNDRGEYQITLNNGTVSIETELYNWLNATNDGFDSRRDIFIQTMDAGGSMLEMYNVSGAYPVETQEIPSLGESGKAFFGLVRFIAEYVQQIYY